MRSQVFSGDNFRPLAYSVAFEHGVICDPAIKNICCYCIGQFNALKKLDDFCGEGVGHRGSSGASAADRCINATCQEVGVPLAAGNDHHR